MREFIRVVSVLVMSLALSYCTTQRVSRELIEVEKAKTINAHYLKVHLKDGFLYVLNEWQINEPAKTITGTGKYYDFNRKLVKSGSISVSFDQIAILETNDKSNNPGVAAMVIVGVITVPLSIYCLINPKACFGSCPTYYVRQGNGDEKLVGEGFSSSICKVLEERDVDIIDLRFEGIKPAQIIVKNEALETHLIRNINLLEVERQQGKRVFQDLSGAFYGVGSMIAPLKVEYEGKSIKDQIEVKDHNEWFSLADSINLLRKENIFLEFENPKEASGLIIDKRQTLMTTFLFYQSLSVTGGATGYYLAEVENGNDWLKGRLEKFYNVLGGIEVAVLNSKNSWETVGIVNEKGPIASDVHLVTLPEMRTDKLKIRLRMTKGLWRIDMVNLAAKTSEVIPRRILPTEVYRGGNKDEASLTKLLNNDEYLVTYPGEVFSVNYPVTFSNDKEYFIESQGYYIEWMREEWLQYQDLKLARKMLLNPSKYLRRVTQAYKIAEPEMEEVFWNSRYPNDHDK